MAGILDSFLANVEGSPSAQVGLQLLAGQDLGTATAAGTHAARANSSAIQKEQQKKLLNDAFGHLQKQGVDLTSPAAMKSFADFAASKGIDADVTLSALSGLGKISDIQGKADARAREERTLQQVLGMIGGDQGVVPSIGSTSPQASGAPQVGLTRIQQAAALLGDKTSLGRLLEAQATQQGKAREAENKPSLAGREAEQKELSKLAVQSFSQAQSDARSATEDRQNLASIRIVDPETGEFAPLKAKLSSVLKSFNITGGEAATDFQTVNAIVTGLGFGVLKGEGQVSDGERVLIAQTLPQLTNTKDAFNFTLSRLDNASRRQQIAAELFRNYKKEKGTTIGADDFVTQTMGEIPSVIANPKGGMPLWFVDFERRAKEASKARGQKISDDQIMEKWLILNGR